MPVLKDIITAHVQYLLVRYTPKKKKACVLHPAPHKTAISWVFTVYYLVLNIHNNAWTATEKERTCSN